jgi:hypothetical protein
MRPDKMIDGITQLADYVNNTVREPDIAEYRFGNLPYADERISYLEGEFSITEFVEMIAPDMDLGLFEGYDITHTGK